MSAMEMAAKWEMLARECAERDYEFVVAWRRARECGAALRAALAGGNAVVVRSSMVAWRAEWIAAQGARSRMEAAHWAEAGAAFGCELALRGEV